MTAAASNYYTATAGPAASFPALTASARVDVAIVGGGFTGLSAALHLAERGIDVALVEAGTVGSGASGLNGGQLHSGQRRDQEWLERHLGLEMARHLWDMAEEAKALIHDLRRRHAIDCDWRDGLIEAVHKPRLVAEERDYVDHLREHYGYNRVTWLDRDAVTARIGTSAYFGGRFDGGAGHLHPLKFARGLAGAAIAAGARIHESTEAVAIAGDAASGFTVTCRGDGAIGELRAGLVILAGNGYLAGLDRFTEARVMPIVNYILTTAPIGAGQGGGLLAGGEAVSDSRFVVYYWRPTPDGRLLFGGGETYRRRYVADPAATVRRHLRRIYPDLADVAVDHAWGGTLAVTMRRLPFIRRVRPGVYAGGGYSGQGVALAPYAGKILADAIAGDTVRFDRFAALPVPPFPGGRLLRFPALVAAMTWYALRDRL